MLRLHAFLVACVALAGSAFCQTGNFALKSGDRIAFYGDSITDNGVYTQLIEIFCVCRYPKLDLWFENAGVGGDRVTGGWMGEIDVRMSRDLFGRKPSVITVMLGMNDASYRAFNDETFRVFRDGYLSMADRIRREMPDARVWLIEPSPYDDVTRAPSFEGGYNAVLKRYGDFVRRLASSFGFYSINMNLPVEDMLKKASAIDSSLAQKLIGDRVHPGGAANFVMAATVLKAWHASPLVSDTAIDWKTGKIASSGAAVSNWSKGEFDMLEDSLPMPIERKNPEYALMLKSSEVEQSLNHQILRVNSMPEGTYKLLIDSGEVGQFTSAQFAEGINLALLDTPMNKQGWRVAELSWKLIGARYNRWRTYEVSLAGTEDTQRIKLLRALSDYENAIWQARKRAAKPVAHHFKIVAAS